MVRLIPMISLAIAQAFAVVAPIPFLMGFFVRQFFFPTQDQIMATTSDYQAQIDRLTASAAAAETSKADAVAAAVAQVSQDHADSLMAATDQASQDHSDNLAAVTAAVDAEVAAVGA